MLYEFKCRATGSVVMTQAVAERILGIVGKAPGATGIFTVDQMPAAIRALEAAIAAERAAGVAPADAPADDDAREDPARPAVTLAQRAFPFVEMLKAAHAAGRDITWGA
jgi:cyclopropane-fatty-acyl-phospholipid synthase